MHGKRKMSRQNNRNEVRTVRKLILITEKNNREKDTA